MRQRTTFFWPVSIVIGFLLMLSFLWAEGTSVVTIAQNTCNSQYTPAQCTATSVARTAAAAATASARAANQTATRAAYIAPTNTPTATATSTPTSEPGASQPEAPTPTATLTPTPDAEATATPTATATLTPPPVATSVVENNEQQRSLLPSPTSILPPGIEARACVPSEQIEITGRGLPGTSLIVLFDRRPVGGGAVRADGSFRITLRIGAERPGLYLVTVEQRDSRALVEQFGCDVPAATPVPTLIVPTPTPTLRMPG